ncbi:MAG: FkbM family methyltransferase [Chloroflexi bacterium]|nr:FkbM family methyltransferase [Chloroflexota bacterium]
MLKPIRRLWRRSRRTSLPTRLALARLERLPRYTPGQITLGGWQIAYLDGDSLAKMYKLQMLEAYNDFRAAHPAPVILDCGANIGVSVLRYKQLYPQAQITAFEPDPALVATLRGNLAQNQRADVTVVPAAVWISEGALAFVRTTHPEAGHLDLAAAAPAEAVERVPTVDFAAYLQGPVDLVKLDIEGAELAVLRHCAPQLHNVRQLFVEVHHRYHEPQALAEIFALLAEAGLRVAVHQRFRLDYTKLIDSQPSTKFNQALVVFAWRAAPVSG